MLTAIPFWIVIYDVFRNPKVGAVVILIFAFVQIVVHMVYFLHMNYEIRRRLDGPGADIHLRSLSSSPWPVRCG